MPSDHAPFIAELPKAELHVHHVGSASPRIVADLASRHPDSPVPTDPATLASYFTFTDFAAFVEVYLSVIDLVRDAEDVRLLTYEIARDIGRAAGALRGADDDSVHLGDPGDLRRSVLRGGEDARVAAQRDFGLVLRWCFDIPGELGLAAAEQTVRIATEIAPDGLVSFGLGGPELGVPRPQFKPFFDRARAAGLHSVPHAGETTGAQTVWDAIDLLGAERIGHGVSAAQDPRLLAHLAEHRIPLEVCLTSNLATHAVASLEDHPLPVFVAAGVPVTINSDDPPMFGTSLNQEYEVAARLLDLDQAGLADLARSAVDASFADPDVKTEITAAIVSCRVPDDLSLSRRQESRGPDDFS